MNETILTWLIFILAFGGMVLVHEFGHFIAARLSRVEVEEFGVGLPTPGALTLWSNKGFLLLKSGKRIEIPFNFRMPLNWNYLIEREVKITVDQVRDHLVMRSIEVDIVEEQERPAARSQELNHVYVDRNGKVIPAQETEAETSHKTIRAGKTSGAMELTDTVREVHPGTRFTLNWLPFGGFVRPKGENDPNVPGGLAAASPWKRLFVLSAGPLMNLLTAVLIYSFIVTRAGVPTPEHIAITDIVENSPAAEAGIQVGDILLEGNGQTIRGYEDLRGIIDPSEGTPVVFLVDRNSEQIELTVIPRRSETDQRVVIGVYFAEQYIYQPVASPIQAVQFGTRATYNSMRALIALPAQLLRGSLPAEQSRLIGLKGIYDIMKQTVAKDVEASRLPAPPNPFDQMRTLGIVASLSISLGLFNLFPFPALDGGRIIFILPELIFRRRVSPQLENMVHAAGMAFLLLLMIYINVMDFINPINITIP
ncbi:MAG: site-2 protease family protein [Anaerolineales bacterium]|nr:site-2 protease family protein [Anaerolineales bacterium]